MAESEQAPGVYVPYSETPEVSVWVCDKNLQLFSNVSEEIARMKANNETGHIFFFAELSTDSDEVQHEEHYRDAITGKFVKEEEAVAHPDTTVHEEG